MAQRLPLLDALGGLVAVALALPACRRDATERLEPAAEVVVPTAVVPSSSPRPAPRKAWPTQDLARFALENLDVTSFPSSFGPRQLPKGTRFSDVEAVESASRCSASAVARNPDGQEGWHYSLLVLKPIELSGQSLLATCYFDECLGGCSYFNQEPLLLRLMPGNRVEAVTDIPMPEALAAHCPRYSRRQDAAPPYPDLPEVDGLCSPQSAAPRASAFPPARAPKKLQVPEGIVNFHLMDMSAADLAEAIGPIVGEEVTVDPALEGAYGCRRFSFVEKRVVAAQPSAAAKLLDTAHLGLRRVDGWWVVGPGPALAPCAPAP
jgi:hypothetical protein